MARDIEEFLRRAAERRQQQKGGQPAKPARPIEEVKVEIVTPRLVQQPAKRPEVVRPTVVPKVKTSQSDFRNESVSDHVQTHLDNRSIGQHAENLGQRISSVHDQVDQQIHQRLDHDISQIDDLPTITDDTPSEVTGVQAAPVATELLTMLSNPRSIQQAILMAEILNRPDWDAEL